MLYVGLRRLSITAIKKRTRNTNKLYVWVRTNGFYGGTGRRDFHCLSARRVVFMISPPIILNTYRVHRIRWRDAFEILNALRKKKKKRIHDHFEIHRKQKIDHRRYRSRTARETDCVSFEQTKNRKRKSFVNECTNTRDTWNKRTRCTGSSEKARTRIHTRRA